jgi:pilus assembly protein TadC
MQATNAILPAIVERIVMAVHAGLDIIPAIERVVQLERKECNILGRKPDPVSFILENVLNRYYSGARLEEALEEHARKSASIAIRHAFIHLAIAHREGGEIIIPLRELSDATQLMYQEEIEEAINTLPVRATIPLVLTFAGLILCFLATPVIQVLNISQRQSQELSHESH